MLRAKAMPTSRFHRQAGTDWLAGYLSTFGVQEQQKDSNTTAVKWFIQQKAYKEYVQMPAGNFSKVTGKATKLQTVNFDENKRQWEV